MTTTILPSRNEAWGFFGTMESSGTDTMQAWNAASARIATATGASAEGVRDFLDSRHGRHFADEVVGGAGAGKGSRSRHRSGRRPLDGLAHRPQDQPRDRNPGGAALPDGLRHPLRYPRRDARLSASPFRLGRAWEHGSEP